MESFWRRMYGSFRRTKTSKLWNLRNNSQRPASQSAKAEISEFFSRNIAKFVSKTYVDKRGGMGLTVTEVLLMEYGKAGVPRRLSDPFWFQRQCLPANPRGLPLF